ncbi:MAG: FAD-dependent oxidoreductase [Saprospiraceae bacterium]|nr:FAD-dependent oxidoreductase [Saprospiraceae bacterium]
MNHPNSLSFWERDSFFNGIDVAIIGSGIVGISAALALLDRTPTLSVAVVERGVLPEGASTRNAGFACFGSMTELLDDLTTMSESDVFTLVERRFKGLERLRARVGDQNLRYQALGGYEIFKNTEGGIFEECINKKAYFNKQLASITGQKQTYKLSKTNFGFQNVLPMLIHNTAEGQIDTGKMMTSLLALARERGVRFFNGLKIEHIHDSNANNSANVELVTSEGWSFTARKVIVATNGFVQRLLPNIEVEAARNQVIVTQPLPNLKIKGCFHYDRGYVYFRNIGNRLLLGGSRNLDYKNEKTDIFGTTDVIKSALNALLETIILPKEKIEIDASWSGIMGIGRVKKPIIQHLSPNVVVSVRMGGMGVAIGSLVGDEAAALVGT